MKLIFVPRNRTSRRRLAAATMLAALALPSFSSSSTAQPAAVAAADPKLLLEAQTQLSAGNPKQAYMLLIARQDRWAGDPEFDYLLGVAALDSGKIDESIIAFERVLAARPKNAGALMDLARAYYTAGSLDLAEATFLQLKASNPPAAAAPAIERYLQAIAHKRDAGKPSFYAWSELSLGYDSNITGVPTDFTAAVQSAFNIPGVDATGNSIKRKAPYLGAALGADYARPFGAGWTALLGGELRGRAYRKEADFNSLYGEAHAGAQWNREAHSVKLIGSANRYNQDGEAPGDPRPTNDRTTGTLAADYGYAISPRQQLTFGVSGSRVRFPKNDIEDFDALAISVAWLKGFDGKGAPVLQLSGYFSRDEAVRKLADGVSDKSKRVAGVRGYFQYSLTEKLAGFSSLGFTQRRDQSAYARATEVEIGRDRLGDLTLGVNWRFQPKCGVRVQWAASRNDSNIAIYDYTRHELSSNVRCDFQ